MTDSSPPVPPVDPILYRRTLRFLASVAAEKAGTTLTGGQPLGGSYLYKLDSTKLTPKALAEGIYKLVDANLPITTKNVSHADLSSYFLKAKLPVAAKLISKRTALNVDVYNIDGHLRLNHFELFGNTSDMAKGAFHISELSADGHFFLTPGNAAPSSQPKLLESINDIRKWGSTAGVTSVADLDALEVVGRGRKDFALQSEFRQDMKIAEIVSQIKNSETEIKLICIAGPTSSGKTTFATKLSMYLNNIGRPAIPLTVDHYYLPIAEQPDFIKYKDRTKVDYDSIRSMDIALVQKHLASLIAGEKIMSPNYSFKTGNREGPGHPIQLPKNGILVIEGIHALNPEYTKSVTRAKIFKIFLSPITQLQLDDYNVLKSTHSRLLRRMSRDYLFRGHSASHTLRMWANVRRGEGKWIFPFQNDVNYICNSALEYELGVLKVKTEPLLRSLSPSDPNFTIATELLAILSQVGAWDSSCVPTTSLMREFIGGGVFDKH